MPAATATKPAHDHCVTGGGGTMTDEPSTTGSPFVDGFLVGGRGVADLLHCGRFAPAAALVEAARMQAQTRLVDGVKLTNVAGAAAYLGRSEQWVALTASPKQRPKTGFPAPVTIAGERGNWYPLPDLAEYRKTFVAKTRAARPAPPPRAARAGHPDELITTTQFRELVNASQSVFKRYVQDSIAAWDRGEDGYLPLWDDREQHRNGGWIYKWRRVRALAWIDSRPGRGRGSGRPAGVRPGVADASAALAAAAARGHQMSGGELAAELDVPLDRAYTLLREVRASR